MPEREKEGGDKHEQTDRIQVIANYLQEDQHSFNIRSLTNADLEKIPNMVLSA